MSIQKNRNSEVKLSKELDLSNDFEWRIGLPFPRWMNSFNVPPHSSSVIALLIVSTGVPLGSSLMMRRFVAEHC